MNNLLKILILYFIVFASSCNGQVENNNHKSAETINDVMQSLVPGNVSTTVSGYMMSADIDGQHWQATQMMEINTSNTHFVHGEDQHHKIEFYIDIDHLKPGALHSLDKKTHGASLYLPDGNIANSVKGNYTITDADDKMIEGTFHFTANPFQTNKIIHVTNGRFRILTNKIR